MSVVENILNSKTSGKSLSTSVSQSTFGELPVLIITHKTCTAAVSLQGAQLLFWQPAEEATPVIWLSEKTMFKKGTAIRGGVPICWPWFGKLGDPMHGFARIVEWQLDSVKEDDNGVDLVLSLTNNEHTKSFFSKPFHVTLTIHLGKSCQVELSCSGDFDATSALHTYFGVDNIENVIVTNLGNNYEERTSGENKPRVEGQLTFNQEVDRIYTASDNIVIIKDGKRTIQLTNNNSSDIVTWNPWSEKSKSMVDMADDGYKTMVCVETSRVNKVLTLSPTQKTTYGFDITLI